MSEWPHCRTAMVSEPPLAEVFERIRTGLARLSVAEQGRELVRRVEAVGIDGREGDGNAELTS